MFALFAHIRLFFMAFSFAASSLMLLGMTMGREEIMELRLGLSERAAVYILQHPEFMEYAAQLYTTFSPESAPTEPSEGALRVERTGNSLQALKSRQRGS